MTAELGAASTALAPEIRGVSKANAAARRFQVGVALGVMAIPALGLAAGVAEALTRGVGALELGLLGGMYLVSTLGVSMGYHRHFAHRAFKTSRVMQLVLSAMGSMAAQGPLLFWVATHRRHHAYSDRPGDPHSPNLHGGGLVGRLRGFWHGHMGWMLSDEITSWPHFARDLMRDRFIFNLHRLYPVWMLLGLLLPAAVGGWATRSAAGALSGFLWGGLIRILLVNQASWCVGSISHMFGSRPFVTRDRSANNLIVAFFTFGEGLQNNHHAFPSSAMHALRWWEPDLSGWLLRLCERLGLIWDVKHPSPRAISEGRSGKPLCNIGLIEGDG